MAKKADGRNSGTKYRPIGTNTNPIKFDTEGTDAHGREVNLIRDDSPTRIDVVSETLYYLGWAEYGSSESEPVWKIKRIEQIGSVWEQKFAGGEQFFRYAWDDRYTLTYL